MTTSDIQIQLVHDGSRPVFRITSAGSEPVKIRDFSLWNRESGEPLWWVVSAPSGDGEWFQARGEVVTAPQSEPVLVGGTHTLLTAVAPDDPTLKFIRDRQREWTDIAPAITDIVFPIVPPGYSQVLPPDKVPAALNAGGRYAIVVHGYASARLEFNA